MSTAPIVAYFDTNVWVAMARGRQAGDIQWVQTISGLCDAVSESRLNVALTAVQYLEVWHRGNQGLS